LLKSLLQDRKRLEGISDQIVGHVQIVDGRWNFQINTDYYGTLIV
jgi:hypothetical protein